MLKILFFAAMAASSAAFGHMLLRETRELQASEMKLATINPYATATQQNQQIAGALAQINSARASAQQAQQP